MSTLLTFLGVGLLLYGCWLAWPPLLFWVCAWIVFKGADEYAKAHHGPDLHG